jgi:hypothetical protein
MTGWRRTAVVVGAVVGLVVVASGAAQADVGTTSLVSVSSTGTPGNAASYGPNGSMMSADGRYVAFSSVASNLVPGDTNGTVDVFVRDTRPAR